MSLLSVLSVTLAYWRASTGVRPQVRTARKYMTGFCFYAVFAKIRGIYVEKQRFSATIDTVSGDAQIVARETVG